jgi:hypothetical protein
LHLVARAFRPLAIISELRRTRERRARGGSRDRGLKAVIILNDWAARDLAVKVGDPITLEYYAWEEPGRLVTRTADFEIAAIVPIAGAAADRDLAPVYPGISDTASLRDWDPPFPIDLRRVRRVDEDYWDKYPDDAEGVRGAGGRAVAVALAIRRSDVGSHHAEGR